MTELQFHSPDAAAGWKFGSVEIAPVLEFLQGWAMLTLRTGTLVVFGACICAITYKAVTLKNLLCLSEFQSKPSTLESVSLSSLTLDPENGGESERCWIRWNSPGGNWLCSRRVQVLNQSTCCPDLSPIKKRFWESCHEDSTKETLNCGGAGIL